MIPIRDRSPSGKLPLVTYLIIALNIYVFVIQNTSSDPIAFIYSWALLPNLIDWANINGIVPFITSQFVHGSILHILSNMWFLQVFGDNVEHSLGQLRYFVFYIISGVVAAFVQLQFMDVSNKPMLGASGAISGVLGFYLAHFAKHKVDVILPLGLLLSRTTLKAQTVLLLWFVSQLFYGAVGFIVNAGAEGGVAWWAHIGGFVFGYIIGKLSIAPKHQAQEFRLDHVYQ